MDDTEQVLRAVEAEAAAGRPFALATIVATSGSTYRHAGARLIVTADGSWTGNLSGGCLEGEVLAVGQRVMDTEVSELASYDLTADEEAIWGWGLGCNGAIDVLVEPAARALRTVRLLRRGQASARPFTLVIPLDDGGPPPTLRLADGTVDGDAALLSESDGDGRSHVEERAGHDVFVEEVSPPLRLVVCGAGHDARPLVRQASTLGWDVTVVDDRSQFLDRERFPEAGRFVHTPPREAAEAVGADALTSVVVMSHNFVRDAEYLASFLGTGVAYLGMLGPARRLQRLLDHIADEVEPSAHDRAVLHGPAGLDLGAEGPEEIAWAICAEVLAVSRGRTGRPLRERDEPIHDRS